MKKPLISVIIPVLNGDRYIKEAIESVFDQKYEPLEIIVVDDGSTDNTAKIVKTLNGNIKYHYQQNTGVATARNKGIELAYGDYVAFIDADDIWLKHKISSQLVLFAENKDIEIVQGYIKRFVSPGTTPPPHFAKNIDEQPVLSLSLGTGLFKKSVFDKIGLFDETLKFSEDIDWFLRAIEGGIIISVLEEMVYLYRLHESNMTIDVKNTNMYLLRAFKKSLDRRRQLNPENPVPLPNIKNPERLNSFLNTKQK